MKFLRSLFFYGLAGYAGWSGIGYATTTDVKFPSQPYYNLANLEPFSGEEEQVCYKEDYQIEDEQSTLEQGKAPEFGDKH